MKALIAVEDALARAKAGELLGPGEVQAILRIKSSQFNVLNHQGALDRFKVQPAIGIKCYSGTLLYRYVQGEPIDAPSFGRKRASR